MHSSHLDWLQTRCLQKVLKHDSLNHRRILSSTFIQIDFFLRVHAARTRASCTHRRSCLYMRRYFQTEPVKDIQPVVNTGMWGDVSVFYLCCLLTTSPSCGPKFDWWRRFESIFLNSSNTRVPVLDLSFIAECCNEGSVWNCSSFLRLW